MNKTLDDDNTYKQIKKDPLRTITNKTNNLLKIWLDNKIIDDNMYKGLKCTKGNLPRCYGLLKVHKESSPQNYGFIGGKLYYVPYITLPDSFMRCSVILLKNRILI